MFNVLFDSLATHVAPRSSSGLFHLHSTLRLGGGITTLNSDGLEVPAAHSRRNEAADQTLRSTPNDTRTPHLTPREAEVLLWAAQGKTAWETAQLLGLTERTVKFYLARACARLDVRNKTQAVAVCFKLGLLSI